MKITHTTLVTAALLAATALLVAPTAPAAKKGSEAKPDLAVIKVEVSRAYLVVGPNGKTPTFAVSVSLKNVGKGAARQSTTSIVLIQDGKVRDRQEVPAPAIAPGHVSKQIAFFHNAELTLGFLHGGGVADSTIAGPQANDSKVSAAVPVIAQRWLARGMEVEEKTPGAGLGGTENDDTVTSSIIFQFSRLAAHPARFFYKASGELTETTTVSGTCSAEGDKSASMSPWGQDSGLSISKSLTQYQATVRASLAKSFVIGETCQDIPATLPLTVRFHDLLTTIGTHGAPRPMSPEERKLSGRDPPGGGSIMYTWTLDADVP